MKDEESGGESDNESKGNNGVAGEEADIRDVIYNLETLGLSWIMFWMLNGFTHCLSES